MTRLTDSPSPSVVQGAHIINTSVTTLSGQDAFSIRFQSPEIRFDIGDPTIEPLRIPSQEQMRITTFDPATKKTYSVGYSADAAFYELYYPIFQQMKESFKITG